MRRFVLLFTAITVAAAASGKRASRIGVSAALGVGISTGEPKSTPVVLRVAGYYDVTGRLSAGIGTGLSFYEETLLPLYADVRFLILRPRRFTPYAGCAAGYAFAPQRAANGGLLLDPYVGVQYALRGKGRIFAEAGYDMQRLERLRKYDGPRFSAQFAEKLRHGTLLLKIGFRF